MIESDMIDICHAILDSVDRDSDSTRCERTRERESEGESGLEGDR